MRYFKILSENATLPTRGTSQAAGYDLSASESIEIPPGITSLVKTDVAVFMPSNEFFMIKSRSGLSYKKGVIVGAGVIDADFAPNPIGVVIHNWTNEPLVFSKGDKVAQGIFLSYLTTNDDQATEERTGGFGSTDKK